MTVGISPTSWFQDLPYITLQEFKNAPTTVDINNLVVGGTSQAQDAELSNVITRASSFMDEYLNQNLNASSNIENQTVRFDNRGNIVFHPDCDPVIALESFKYGTTPNSLTTLADCSIAWFEPEQITVPLGSASWSSQGSLSFGAGSPRQQVYIQYQYSSGYVNNLIAVATAGQSQFTAQSPVGIAAGMTFKIFDGANTENVTVASNYVYGSTTVPITAPLAFTHANTVSFGNLPNAIKQACILITTAFLKVRGDSSMTMAMTVNPSRNAAGSAGTVVGDEITLALGMVDLYRRIR